MYEESLWLLLRFAHTFNMVDVMFILERHRASTQVMTFYKDGKVQSRRQSGSLFDGNEEFVPIANLAFG